MTFPLPEAVIHGHTAAVGKTGSGKTSTAKLIVEHVATLAQPARVCVLDSIKSDWWGVTSSADGKRPGLPFHILGGPHGHVPLNSSAGKAIGELVATGGLPLSIIDMADFEPGGLQRFFVDFAPTLLRKMRGVLYLVLEEAHEFAPKERSGIGQENLAIHWAKKLATAGRSKGIRLIVATQRTQALHNALLGSCETMMAHRLTAPADQAPVAKWLMANLAKDQAKEIEGGLASLKTGSAWVISGEAQFVKLVQFPRISTFDNSATPTGKEADRQVKTAPVDLDKLRSVIGDAVKDAEASDPKVLRKRIADLEAAAKSAPKATASVEIRQNLTKSDERALGAAFLEGQASVRAMIPEMLDAQHATSFEEGLRAGVACAAVAAKAAPIVPVPNRRLTREIKTLMSQHETDAPRSPKVPQGTNGSAPVAQRTESRNSTPVVAGSNPAGRATGSVRERILRALAELEAIGISPAPRIQAAFLAGYAHAGVPNFRNSLGRLRSLGFVDYPSSGTVKAEPTLFLEGR